MSAPMSHEIATEAGSRSLGPIPMDRLHLVSLQPVGHRPVLGGDVAAELTRVFMDIAAHSGYRVMSVSILPDHVNLVVELGGLHRPESVTRELRANHLWI